MKYFVTLNPETVQRVKKLLSKNGIRETARKAGVSYYTAWSIKNGKYDNDKPLQENMYSPSRCPITGLEF